MRLKVVKSKILDEGPVNHDLLLSHSNFVSKLFLLPKNRVSSLSSSWLLLHVYNPLIIRDMSFLLGGGGGGGGGEGIATKIFYDDHFTIEGHQKVIFWKAWSPAWMYLAKHHYKY